MHRTATNVLNRLFALFLCLLLLISLSVPVGAESSEKQYVASINSDVYHFVGCGQANRIQGYNRIYFSSRSEAIASGRRACYYCGDDYVCSDNSADSEYSKASSPQNEKSDIATTKIKNKTERRFCLVFGFAINIALWCLAKKTSISFRFIDTLYRRLPNSIIVVACFILAILLSFAILSVVFIFGGLVYEALLENNIRKAVLIIVADIVCIFVWESTTRR